METIRFKSLPLSVRITTAASWFMGWVLTAEFVIDRYGFDEYLPLYRVGDLCPYDIAVLILISFAWVRLSR